MGRLLLTAEVEQTMQRLHASGAQIVSTNGCFDVLHIGHIRYLQQASELGTVLVVGLNSDASVRRLKGAGRPILPQMERAEMLCALECVDYVTIFDEDRPDDLLNCIRPNIHVKGGDYTADQLPEGAVVRAHGGTVRTLALVPGRSSTDLVQRIVAVYGAPHQHAVTNCSANTDEE